MTPRDSTVAIVLNYRTPHDTIEAVRSLEGSDPPLARIIVVDNASNDGSVDLLRAALPEAHIIANRANEGFSSGCNHGIREAQRLGAQRVFLLNSDALVGADTIRRLGDVFDSSPRLGIVGPAVVSRRNPDEVESLGMRYSSATARMRHAGARHRVDVPGRAAVRMVAGVSGSAMLIRSEVFDEVGLLSEEFFFGFEDLDFCLRARDAGYLTACVHGVQVLHEGNLSIGAGSAVRIYYGTRNHLLLGTRYPPSASALSRAGRVASILALNLAHAVTTRSVPILPALRAYVRGVRDHFAGRYGAAPRSLSGGGG